MYCHDESLIVAIRHTELFLAVVVVVVVVAAAAAAAAVTIAC